MKNVQPGQRVRVHGCDAVVLSTWGDDVEIQYNDGDKGVVHRDYVRPGRNGW